MVGPIAIGLSKVINGVGWVGAIGVSAAGLLQILEGAWYATSRTVMLLWARLEAVINGKVFDPDSIEIREKIATITKGGEMIIKGLGLIAGGELLKVGAAYCLGPKPIFIDKILDVIGWRVVTRVWI